MTLGLFPLNLVLFPGVRLSLHIFEPRYKALVNGCLERGLEFGINYFEEGHLHSVGCVASIVDVVKRYPDGRMDIIVEGMRRYRLLEIATSDMPFAVGAIDDYADSEWAIDTSLLQRVLDRYNRIVTLVYGVGARTFTVEDLSQTPSFDLAPKAGLSTQQKQHLLEAQDENARLAILDVHMTDMLPSVVRAETMQRVIRNDGYLRR